MKPTAREKGRRSRLNEVLGLKLKPIEEQIINIKLRRAEDQQAIKPIVESEQVTNRPMTRL